MDKWQTKRILILGTTYPSHSQKYTEIVCTGGIEEDTRQMVRLHPVPLRYLRSAQRFKAFQFITARVMKHDTDPRPESYRIDPQSIVLGEVISAKQHMLRRNYLETSPQLVNSVEELKGRYERDRTSLGIVIPKDILDCGIVKRPESDRKEWISLEQTRANQQVLFGERPKPLDYIDAKFMVRWNCDDERCEGHNMGIHQWGLHELYRKYRNTPDGYDKVIEAMQKKLDQGERDVFLFLGSFRAKMFNFGLMDSYSAPARDPGKLTTSLFM